MPGNETPTGGTLDTLLRRSVEAHPDRCALRGQGQSWTYTELDRRVGRLAGALRERGVGPGTRVGLLLPRSAECVALILAVLRRGAAYVPLDPGHPARRLAYVRRHSGVHLLATADGHTAPPGPGEDVALADLLLEGEGCTTDAPSSSDATPDGTAHVLYTSGSTGTPKGVRLSHRAVANNVRACVRTFGLRPDDTLVLKTPLTFDVSAYEMFSALAAGACLVVAPPGAEGDPDLLAATVDNHRVTVLFTVPAQLRALTETGAFARNTSLRAVMSTGEKLPAALQRAFHGVRREPLYNFYGPTETAFATAYRAVPENAATWADQASVPIGQPLDNVRCYVLDDTGRPAPDGQAGELHVGGESLADGYLDDDERTRERFHHVDLGGGRTDRVYRTGDLVRRLPGGDLLYLGRADDQIKIAGQRIELGEVESAILDVPGVRAVAVTVRERDPDGAPELSAFVEFDPTGHRTTTELRTALAAWLPARMVPAHLVPVARIPLLSNGKTDRLALARLHPSTPAPRPPGGRPVTPLRQDTPMAELVRRCFTEALGGPPPTDDSHFLHEGGDSLLAMRVVARLRRAGVPISVAEFLSHPVLADLVAYLGRSPARPVPPETGGARPATAPTAVAPVHEWFTERVRTDRTYWNMFVRLRVLRPLVPAHLEAALRALVAAHPALRARFVDDGTGVRMAPAEGIAPDRLVRTLDVTGTAERDAAVDRLHRSLDPSTGDHLRALVVHDREGDATYLVVAIHHLVVDIVSWHVLLDDLVVTLDALERGEEPALPAQAETFQGWIEALPALGADPHEAAYWLSVLRLRRAAPSLAARGPARPEQAGGLLTFRVPAAKTRQLLGPAPVRLGMCVHDVMAAAVGLALARWRPDGAVTFDLETHGRHRWPQLDRVVGWFTAVFPVAWPSAPATDLATELAPARAALAAVPHGGTGYGVLRRHAGDPGTAAALRATPPALVCFNYLGRGDLGPPGDRFRPDGTPVPWEARSPRAERPYPVEVSAVVLDDQLAVWLSWAPSPADGLDESSVRRLRTHLRTVLDELALARVAEVVNGAAPPPAHRQPGLHR
ncbi:amino acid adenylation domain-containing protein [Micromonospora okii]|uniref:amino acid adenylation domain-containing protein n=1 Tax=Micromonospora okii TaxID=1182970 RepID=UPI00272EA217|nr:amino acid adenylation domain-containing protein [Micromonospora okii]